MLCMIFYIMWIGCKGRLIVIFGDGFFVKKSGFLTVSVYFVNQNRLNLCFFVLFCLYAVLFQPTWICRSEEAPGSGPPNGTARCPVGSGKGRGVACLSICVCRSGGHVPVRMALLRRGSGGSFSRGAPPVRCPGAGVWKRRHEWQETKNPQSEGCGFSVLSYLDSNQE